MLHLIKEWCPCLWWLQEKSTRRKEHNEEGYYGSDHDEQIPCASSSRQIHGNDAAGPVWERVPDSCWLAEEDTSSSEACTQPLPQQISMSRSNMYIRASSPQSISNRGIPARTQSEQSHPYEGERTPSHASTASTQKGNCGIGWNSDVEISPPVDVRLDSPAPPPDPALDRFLIGGYMTPQIVGRANSTRRYNPLQRIPRHNTPFEERMEHEILEEATARSAVRKRRPRIGT